MKTDIRTLFAALAIGAVCHVSVAGAQTAGGVVSGSGVYAPGAPLPTTFDAFSPRRTGLNELYADPLAGNPEGAKLRDAEAEAARDAQSLLSQFQQAKSDAQRSDLKGKLREALVQQFEAQQKRRALEITTIQERLAKYSETLKKRDSAKETIVNRRLDHITGAGDDLGWEEFGASAIRPRPAPQVPWNPPVPVGPSAIPPPSSSNDGIPKP